MMKTSVRHLRRFSTCGVVFVLLIVLGSSGLTAEETSPLRVLFLSKSSGFEHSAIKRSDGQPSPVETVLEALAERQGFELETTKNAGLITSESLGRYDVVIFYTTGDLTTAGSGEGIFGGDGEGVMAADGVEQLISWIESGGGFMGFHCATDTFHGADGEVSPYIALIGGEFATHGQQFEGTLEVVDPEHPTARSLPARWHKKDEWYLFKNFDEKSVHVVARLDPGAERKKQQVYDIDPYPVIWTKTLGGGRVYYNAMGHREDVWDDEIFQGAVYDAIRWTAGDRD